MHTFKTAKINEGEDWMKLSFIFRRTINPEIINRLNPMEANKDNTGLK